MESEQSAPGTDEPDRLRGRFAPGVRLEVRFKLCKTAEHTFVQQLSKYVIHAEHSRRVDSLMRSIVLRGSDNF